MAKHKTLTTAALTQEVYNLHEYICNQNRRIKPLEELRTLWQDIYAHNDRIKRLEARADNLHVAVKELGLEHYAKQKRGYFHNLWAALRNKR